MHYRCIRADTVLFTVAVNVTCPRSPLRLPEQLVCRCFSLLSLIFLRVFIVGTCSHVRMCVSMRTRDFSICRQCESCRAIARTWQMNINCTSKTILNSCNIIRWSPCLCVNQTNERRAVIVLVCLYQGSSHHWHSTKPIRSQVCWFATFCDGTFIPALENGSISSTCMLVCISNMNTKCKM